MQARYYRSRSDSMIAGVCGGLGHYLGVDTMLVRLAFLLLAVFTGLGGVLYLALWIVARREDVTADSYGEGAVEMTRQARNFRSRFGEGSLRSHPQFGLFAGLSLVLLGALLLAENFGMYLPHWLGADLFWPLMLIAAGVVLMRRRARVA
jgi:phage shock protein C